MADIPNSIVNDFDASPGISQDLIIALTDYLESVPQPVSPTIAGATDYEDILTVADDVVTKPGKKFIRVKAIVEQGGISSELQGETKSRGFKNKITFKIQGNKILQTAILTMLRNAYVLIFCQELGSGDVRMLGSAAIPAVLSSGTTGSGSNGAEASQIVFEFHASSPHPHFFFTGKFMETPVGGGTAVELTPDPFNRTV